MPRRVSSTCLRWSSFAAFAASRGVASRDERAATAVPQPSAGGLWTSTTAPNGDAIWAAFSARVMRPSRSLTRSSTGTVAFW